MRLKGKLLKWDNEKAFGFIVSNGGGEHVFIHKNAFSNRQRIPQINDIITFLSPKINKGDIALIAQRFQVKKLRKNRLKA